MIDDNVYQELNIYYFMKNERGVALTSGLKMRIMLKRVMEEIRRRVDKAFLDWLKKFRWNNSTS